MFGPQRPEQFQLLTPHEIRTMMENGGIPNPESVVIYIPRGPDADPDSLEDFEWLSAYLTPARLDEGWAHKAHKKHTSLAGTPSLVMSDQEAAEMAARGLRTAATTIDVMNAGGIGPEEAGTFIGAGAILVGVFLSPPEALFAGLVIMVGGPPVLRWVADKLS